jgi:Ca-activated chloride channel homolog
MNFRSQNIVMGLLLSLPGLLGIDLLRAHNRHVEQGNAEFKSGKPAEALKLYDKALNEDGLADPQARASAEFNRGAAFSALGKPDEAGQAFLEATKSKDSSLRARAFYNLGNTFFKGEKYSEAIEAFKRSLVLDSRNNDAKWNLELALRKKKDQDEKDKDKKKDQDKDKDKDKKDPNNKDKQDDKDKDKQDKSGDKDKDKQDDKPDENGKNGENGEDKKDEQKPDEPKPDEQDQQGKDGKKPEDEPKPEGQQKPQEGKAAPADMKEINAVLDSLEQSPRQIEQQRARVRAMQRRAPVKDW